MAKKAAVSSQATGPVSPEGIGAELTYISRDLRPLAVRIDSLVLDDRNVKILGDEDLPTHAASLREFGIRRAVVVNRSTRRVEAGNGTVLAAQLNGWDHVPVIFEDDDPTRAQAFALADNAVGTLAPWNEDNLAAIAAESAALFSDQSLREMTESLLAQLQIDQPEETPEQSEDSEQTGPQEGDLKPEDVMISYRVIAACRDQAAQFDLLAELTNRGMDCRLSTVRVD